ncbi:MAG: flavoprotein [Candidatus Altiarchaeota archaeon]
MTKIVVGVCGSVAAVRVPELVRELVRQGIEVECAMSENAWNIIHGNVLEWSSGKPVISEITGAVEHVRLCGLEGEASVLLVCPATSNTISKVACGIDDTVITTLAATALASKTKIIVVPAMHQSMYENPFVKENIGKLRKAGVVFVEPKIEEGKAKLPSEEDIIKAVKSVL